MGIARLVRRQGDAGPLRAAVIGCGRIGAAFAAPATEDVLTHAAAYRACALTELVAVCDVNREIVTGCADVWNVVGFDDVDEMLRVSQPEVVSICTPDETHAALSERVLRAHSVRGVLIEKPLAVTVQDAENTLLLAETRGVVLAVNYSRRWAAGIEAVATLLRKGRLGEVGAVTGHYANGWLHNGTHWIDLARMLVGEVTSVRMLQERASYHAEDPSLDVEFRFKRGARGMVYGHARTGLSFFEMDVICELGRVRLSQGAERIDVYELAPSPIYAGFSEHSPLSSSSAGLGQSMLSAVTDVALRVLHGGSAACTGHDGVVALRVAEAARHADGRWIRVPTSR